MMNTIAPAPLFRLLLPLFATMAAALLLANPTYGQGSTINITPDDSRQGTFKAVEGDVTVVRSDVHRAAVIGDGVVSSDRLITGAQSATSLTLRDGTVISVGPDSMVDLERYAYDGTTQAGNIAVRLARGSLRMITGLIAKLSPEDVSVTTPTTTIGVRGTDFIVEARAQ